MNNIRKTVDEFLSVRDTIEQRARALNKARRNDSLDIVSGFDFNSNGIEIMFYNGDSHCDRGDDLITEIVSFEQLEMSPDQFNEHVSRIADETKREQEESMKEAKMQEKIAQYESLKRELGIT